MQMLSSRKLSCLRGPHAGVPSLCPPVAVSTRSPRMSQAPRRSIIVASGAGKAQIRLSAAVCAQALLPHCALLASITPPGPSGGSIMERLREDMKMAMKAKDQVRCEPSGMV
eukprot:980297-Pelagomonas_calceolata.AAC.1